jgi:hypothetical protein
MKPIIGANTTTFNNEFYANYLCVFLDTNKRRMYLGQLILDHHYNTNPELYGISKENLKFKCNLLYCHPIDSAYPPSIYAPEKNEFEITHHHGTTDAFLIGFLPIGDREAVLLHAASAEK